jgi:hypothetical protein
MADARNKCPCCHGRGYTVCECWPGDCICGWGDSECEECGRTGDADWSEDDSFANWIEDDTNG